MSSYENEIGSIIIFITDDKEQIINVEFPYIKYLDIEYTDNIKKDDVNAVLNILYGRWEYNKHIYKTIPMLKEHNKIKIDEIMDPGLFALMINDYHSLVLYKAISEENFEKLYIAWQKSKDSRNYMIEKYVKLMTLKSFIKSKAEHIEDLKDYKRIYDKIAIQSIIE